MKEKHNGLALLPRRFSLNWLKWAAIALPVLFLGGVDFLRHEVFYPQFHTIQGFLFTYFVVVTSVVLFSYTIFGLVGALQAEVKAQNQWLSVINAIALAASQKLRLEELLELALDRVMDILQADACLICLVDLEREEHSVVCYRGFSPEMVKKIQRAKLGDDPIAQEVVRTGRPIVIERVLDDPRVTQAARQEGIRSAISAPLKTEGEVNGILVLATRKERHFTPTDEEFLKAIGGQLGMAIKNSVLFERSQRRTRELIALVKAGRAASSSLDLDEVLRQSLDAVLEVTSADAAEIWLADGDGLTIRAHRGAHPHTFLEHTRFRLGEGFPGIVAESRTPLLIHDLPSDPRFLRQEAIEAGYRTFCALPLLYQGRLVGVMGVAALSADAIKDAGDLQMLEAIGERIAVAIVNAELHRRIEHLAVWQERERIAREMHDGMAQVLSYVNAEILAIKKLHSDRRLGEANQELGKMQEMVQQLYADVREGMLGLRSASHGEEGFLPALKGYLEQYRDMCGMEALCEISSPSEVLRLPPAVEVQLMRIVQEACSNVRKHARATMVRVAIGVDGDELQCEIADNGRGFDPAHLTRTGRPHFGLQTMRERAEAVGGSLTLEARPGHGTKLLVKVPVGDKSNHGKNEGSSG